MASVRSGGDTRPAEAKRLGVVALALVNVGAVLGLRNYPAVALSGWGSIGWYLIGAVCFLIPMALVASELATAWRGDGGIYTWVRTAFGDTAGSVAVFCEWSSNLVRYPAVLAFVASAFVYALDPRLADDGPFMFLVMMVAFWGATLVALLGSRTASVVGAFGVAAGTVAPALVIAGLGIAFIVAGRRPLIPATGIGAVAPHVGGNLPMVGVAILMFSGMEVIGFHTARARDPHHTLPRAMLLSGAIILILAIVGTLAISWVVPASTLELAAGVMQAFEAFLHTFGLSGLFAPLALLVAVGATAGLLSWMVGPALGLRQAAQQGLMPAMFGRVSRRGAPTGVLLMQAGIGTLIAVAYLFIPGITAVYWTLSAITLELGAIVYLLVFASFIRLRFTHAQVPRPFRVPGGKAGAWLCGGVGVAACAFTMGVLLLPPRAAQAGSPLVFAAVMLAGTAALALPPLVLARMGRRRRPASPPPAEPAES